jgi:Holliday junction resolvase RusA-like endonuclease
MKLVLDAMNGIFWSDDALISRSSVEKLYDERPRTEITITEL